MAEGRLPLAALLQKAGEAGFRHGVAEAVLQLLMEADAEGLTGAGRHERSAERLNDRNGHRERMLDTRLGTLQLAGSAAPNPQAAPLGDRRIAVPCGHGSTAVRSMAPISRRSASPGR